MAKYRVRAGHALGHHGRVVGEGGEVELADHVASDPAVQPHVEPIPSPVAVPVPPIRRATATVSPSSSVKE